MSSQYQINLEFPPGSNTHIVFPVMNDPFTGGPCAVQTLDNIYRHINMKAGAIDVHATMLVAEREMHKIIQKWSENVDGYFAPLDSMERQTRLIQWRKILLWLRGHGDWGTGSILDSLCDAVHDLEFDDEDGFLTLYIYWDKSYLNSSDNNRALLLRLSGKTYKDRPAGFPKINSLNVIAKHGVFTSEYLADQSGLPSADITFVDFAPDKPDAWL